MGHCQLLHIVTIHGMVIAGSRCSSGLLMVPRFATIEHSLPNTGLVHIAMYPRWEVSGG